MAPDKGQITTSNLHHATIDYCSEDIITCYYIIIYIIYYILYTIYYILYIL